MIRLVYSNRTEELLASLTEDLLFARKRPGHNIFASTHLVVPNRHVDAYVKTGIATQTGIAFNIKTHLLSELLPALLEGQQVRVLDHNALRGLLLSALLDEQALRDGGDLEPVRDYVHGQGHRDDAADVRKFQLATELASVFLEYAYTRPEVLDDWRSGRLSFADTPYVDDERWQRALWLRVFGEQGVLARRTRETGRRWVTMADLLDPHSPHSVHQLRLPEKVHFFGFSHMGRSFHRLFAALAERTQLFVYTLNPCEEFWEDMQGPRTRAVASRQIDADEDDPFGLEQDSDTPALRLWGRPGRENIRLLNELSDCDFDERFADPLDEGDSLLRTFQHDILKRSNERQRPTSPSRFEGDQSVRVLACPGIRREVETIANEIWRLLGEDPSLRFSDIALVVGPKDAGRYLPQLVAAFNECGGIPHAVLDLPVAGDSRVLEALELLLSLPFGSFGRQDLLRLCTHPVVAARFPDDDPESWVAWAEALGIVHGADHDAHRETYITRDILNWEQGVRRLALGAFMTGERSGDSRTFPVGGEEYLPEEHTQASQLSAGRFALLVRSLIADARFARASRKSLREWVKFFRLLVNSYLAPSSDRDEKEMLACIEALDAIDDGSTGESEVPYRVAYQLALSALSEIRARRGTYPCEGVAVSSFANLRGLPFRVMFMTGLGEGKFPEIDRKNPLDLRVAKQRPGELSLREQDKYAFLETLLSTRERLYLSYVARDPFTGEELQPSSVVLDLLDILERGYMPKSEIETLVERHALRRYDPAYHAQPFQLAFSRFASALPEASREAQALSIGQHLREHLGRVGSIDPRKVAALNPRAWNKLGPLLGLFDLPPEPKDDAPLLPMRLSVSSLRRFLECPLQGHAAYALGLAESEDDALAVEDEPFSTARPRATFQLRTWMTEALVRGVDVLALYDKQMALLEHRGRAPTGVFAEVERAAHRACLRAWQETGNKLAQGKAHVLRFGSADEHGYVDRPIDPIALQVSLPAPHARSLKVEVTGTTSALLSPARGSLLFSTHGFESSDDGLLRQQKLLLRAFFDHVLISSASADREMRSHTAHLIFADGQHTSVLFSPFESAAEARAFLASLIEDLLGRTHPYLLPCEAVFSHKVKGEALEAAVEKVRKLPWFSSRYGPIDRIDDFPALAELEALAVVERRFGPFFTRLGDDALVSPKQKKD